MTREPPTAGSELEIVEEVSSYKRLVEDLDSVFEKLGAVGMRSPSKPLGIIQRDLDKEFDVLLCKIRKEYMALSHAHFQMR